MEATYKFLNYRYEKEPEHCRVPCEVIKETKQSYYIKLLAPNVRGRQYGDCIWVRKDSVIVPKPPVDNSNKWWQDL